jgi:GTP-binding protein HflX
MIERKSHDYKEERAVLVGLITPKQNEKLVEEYLDELQFLALTAGAITHKRFVQRLDKPNTATFVGSGKAEEIKAYVKADKIDSVIFDDELGPTQVRNLEKLLEVKVIDRSALILDIFAQRAQTAHARAQVELAQYQYLYPRLMGMWKHLSRQKGGIGMRGPGETEIETDRRIVRDKISHLKKRLEEIDRQKFTQRQNRGSYVRVALVGYTNVGKSTLINAISKSTVFAENKLFATLDTTVRKVVLNNLPFLLTDTVGFIRKLPHQLVESFKSTLDETREADLLIHVVDISHPKFIDQMTTVNATLQEIHAFDKPQLIIFNKIDQVKEAVKDEFDLTGNEHVFDLQSFRQEWNKTGAFPALFVSALHRDNFEELRTVLYEKISEIHRKIYPYNSFLY